MRNKAFMVYMFVVVMFAVGSCNDGVTGGKDDKPLTLFDTKWKLGGFFDVGKKELEEPDKVEGCEDCYTLEFWPDTVNPLWGEKYRGCNGRMVLLGFGGPYLVDYTLSTIEFNTARPLGEETSYGSRYHVALEATQRFELDSISLKLYYNDGKNYLLLRRQK
jgi:hypothetical protein